jgi:hypothetical protein
MKKRIDINTALRSNHAPTAEDPRCARMTTYGIPLCTRITNETKKQADMLTYNKKEKNDLYR